MGLVPLLRNLLWPPAAPGAPAHHTPKLGLELYGPAGLRLFIRQNLKMTLTRTNDKYIVHELLSKSDPVTPCDEPDSSLGDDRWTPNVMHTSELPGRDIIASPDDDLWRDILRAQSSHATITVDAGPIHHRDPCIGYVFTETTTPLRKLVILGDTYDPHALLPLCINATSDPSDVNPPVSLLVHEATDSHISEKADPSGRLSRRTAAEVEAKALARGHSVPQMAGAFAKKINAQQLVLNHIGARFAAPTHARDFRTIKITNDIAKKATQAWGLKGRQALVAYDYLQVHIPPTTLDELEGNEQGGHLSQATASRPGPSSSAASIISSAVVQRRRAPSQHHLDHHRHQSAPPAPSTESRAKNHDHKSIAVDQQSRQLTSSFNTGSQGPASQSQQSTSTDPRHISSAAHGHGQPAKRGRGGGGVGSDAQSTTPHQQHQQGSRHQKRSRNQ